MQLKTKKKKKFNCADACNEWRDPSPRLSAWATQLVGKPLATLCRFDRYGNRTPDLPHRKRALSN